MAYIEIADLKTHLYAEIIDEITREDDTIITNAINTAIAEAKSYLNSYSLTKLFDPDDDDFVTDANLKNKVKDLVCWHLIGLANPNINYELTQDRYEKALRWFEFIMKGQIDPDGWPAATDDEDTDRTEGSGVSLSTNTKRSNHL